MSPTPPAAGFGYGLQSLGTADEAGAQLYFTPGSDTPT
jgi:hypothetical protein